MVPPSRCTAWRTRARPRPRPNGPGDLVLKPWRKTSSTAPRIDAGAAVLHRDLEGGPGGLDGQLHEPGRRRLGRGVDRVVQQVAEDRHEVLHRQTRSRPWSRASVQAQFDAALMGFGGLAHDQGAEYGLLDGTDKVIGQPLA